MAVIKSLPATKSLSNQLKYLAQEGKTVEELKEGINCTIGNVEREFNIVKQMYNKSEGKQYYHLTQAFSPEDNINPKKAHELGKEWIERNIQGHQVYMVTHIDKNHIHNHFVINSVNIDSGLKLQISPSKLLKMKEDSNKLCSRENLSEINLRANKGISKTDAEYRLEKKGIIPWKDELRQCIDFGKNQTKSIGELKEFLKEHFDIEVRETKNSISYKHPEQNKAVRGNKLGGSYTKEGLLNEFNDREIKSDERGNSTKESRTIKYTGVTGFNNEFERRADSLEQQISQDIRLNGEGKGAVQEQRSRVAEKQRGNIEEGSRNIQDDNRQINNIGEASSRETGQVSKRSGRNEENPHGNDKDIKPDNSSSGKNRYPELEGQSEAICSSNGNNTRGNIDNSRSIPVNKPIKIKDWDMER